MKYDVAVIGGGAAGTRAACAASDAGLSTILFEKGGSGGGVIHSGYHLMDALLEALERKENGQADIINQAQTGVRHISLAIEHNMKTRGITQVNDSASLTGRNDNSFILSSSSERFSAGRLIFATGSLPAIPRLPDIDKAIENGFVITNQELFFKQRLPGHVTIYGGNIRGLQLASYARLRGSEVTVICRNSSVAPELDEEIADLLQKAMTDIGIRFVFNAELTGIAENALLCGVNSEPSAFETGAFVLGNLRWPATRGLGLKTLDIRRQKGAILTDLTGRTSALDVYACGDCTCRTLTAEGAMRDADICVSAITSLRHIKSRPVIPFAMRRVGHAASIGETLTGAAEKKLRPVSSRLPLPYKGHTNGLIKLIGDRVSGRLVGAHLIGDDTDDMVKPLAHAIELGQRVYEIRLAPYSLSGEIASEALYRLNTLL